MQTQYRLLYRYLNESTNTPVTNESEYIKTEEFYTDGHKLNLSPDTLTKLQNKGCWFKYQFDKDSDATFIGTIHNEAESERENLIMENMANEKKSNNLYIYTGTKKTYKKQYIPEQMGYVVRDYTKVPIEQIPSSPDDYTKHFVMLGGEKLGFDGAYLVCKPQYIDVYKKKYNVHTQKKCFLCISADDINNKGYSKNTDFYHNRKNNYIDDISKIIDKEVFFKYYDPKNNDEEIKYGEVAISGTLTKSDNNSTGNISLSSDGQTTYLVTTVRTGAPKPPIYYYIFFNNVSEDINNHKSEITVPIVSASSSYYGIQGYNQDQLIQKGYIYYGEYIEITEDNIIKDVIPAHYEDTGESPYYIKDTYEKINLSPWIQHSVHNSLESALTSARKLVSMIGIDNVKLIKYVPFDQFINIK